MKKVLITGSIAYDHIMTFDGEFSDSILPKELLKLSLSFIANSHVIHFGGCAANIAYNLKFFGIEPCLYGVAGNDFGPYAKWLKEQGILTDVISIDEDNLTAAAYIISDKNQNQFAIFSPGAMANLDMGMHFENLDLNSFDMVILSSGHPNRMVYLAQLCEKNNVPYIFDPGKEIPVLSKEALLTIIENSKGIIINEYEGKMLSKKLNTSLKEIVKKTGFLIETLGEEGCRLITKEKEILIPAINDYDVADTIGCGDAFRAGLIAELLDGGSLERACEAGNTAASFVLQFAGPQHHKFSKEELQKRLVLNYGDKA